MFLGLLWCGWCLCKLDVLWWWVVSRLDVMCVFYILNLQFLMCYSIGSGIGWDTLALLSQSDLDWREQVIRGMGRGYLGLRRHAVYGQFEQRICLVALLFRDKVASLVESLDE